jgi:hypothetical protein
MRTMTSESRRARGRGVGRSLLPIAIAVGILNVGWLAASRPAAAAPVMSRDRPVDPNDDWTLHLALGLEVGAGGTITAFNAFPSNDSTLFFTSVHGTYDLKHGFAALVALRQWWLPGPNHALMLGLGTRFEPFTWSWGRSYADLALGPASTGYAWTFGFDIGLGIDFDLPDVPGLSIGPYFRFGDFINPDRRDSDDGLAWSIGAAFTYHFGRAALAPKPISEQHVRRGAWHITIPDTDRDGVGDDEDQCKDTAAGKHPDPFRPGCPEGDEDGDGVPDIDDPCPVTPPGPTPDPKRLGCPFIDSDGDGVSDADDACATKPGVRSSDPTKNGCPDPKKKAPAAAPPPPSAKDESIAPKPVKKHRSASPPAKSEGGERLH